MKKPWVTAWAAGAIFGVGLVVSGMTDPGNIIGFLDIFGDFRPSLLFVMAGAVAVHAVALRVVRRGEGGALSIAPHARIDAPLLLGAAIFGAGWGLGGYCPGPSLVALGSGRIEAAVFVVASIVGILAADFARGLFGRTREIGSSELPETG